nr:MAG TPA: Porphobilinogen deaminase, C-terminal domain [Caudoviricetes sp.]DAU04218.1 MAG TPA: Porphobilinogen deaminase, C-terminal domain [Caudoviricetes sp.]
MHEQLEQFKEKANAERSSQQEGGGGCKSPEGAAY